MADVQLSVDPSHRSLAVYRLRYDWAQHYIFDVVVQGWAFLAQCVHEVPA